MTTSTSTKVGHGLAKVLGIKLDYRHEHGAEPLSRGESVFSVSSADTYVEEEPTSAEWLREICPSKQTAIHYVTGLFPFLKWITRYNLTWLTGDLIAGITVGCVVVPQSMSYAGLALLEPQFGLYSAFMGVLVYWIFATSKDITIGPVAVMSTLVGNIVAEAHAQKLGVDYHEIASALGVISGGIIAFLGFTRLGFVVEFISATAVASFITGAALYILCGQVPNLLGLDTDYINTHGPSYLTIIHTLQYLHTGGLAAAVGMTALFSLYLWRFTCNQLAKKYPKKAKVFFLISTVRTAVIVLFYTMVSWLANMNIKGIKEDKDLALFSIVGTVPRGFQNAGVPRVDAKVVSFFASQLPATIIVLLIEHIAIAKSFGRINNYTINPSQEMIGIGITNLLGPFLGAYPATGSFTRTAISSKAGVRTPFAGFITAVVVLIAIYALPPVFFWIPSAVLSAVIIHAVGDLILAPNSVYQIWRVSPLEVVIFFVGVITTMFSTIEDGIYVTVASSAGILLFRLAKARGRFLGKVNVHSVIGDHLIEEKAGGKYDLKVREQDMGVVGAGSKVTKTGEVTRTVFLPLNKMDGSNPSVDVQKPYPGIFIYRFSEGFNYPNCNHYLDDLVQTIFKETRRTNPFSFPTIGERPWNDPGPRQGKPIEVDYSKPTLKAVILDFSSVNNVDVTVMQNLIDVRNQLERYAAPDALEFHIAAINNRWTKRALVASGFGYPTPSSATGEYQRWKPLFSVAEFGGNNSAAAAAEQEFSEHQQHDIETGNIRVSMSTRPSKAKMALIHGMNRPFFHIDVWSAVQSAISSIEGNAAYAAEIAAASVVEEKGAQVASSEAGSSQP